MSDLQSRLVAASKVGVVFALVIALELGIAQLPPTVIDVGFTEVQIDNATASAQRFQRSRRSKKDDKKKERRVPPMKQSTYDDLTEIEEWIGEKEYVKAKEQLDKMVSRGTRRYNGNELANVHRSYAYFSYETGDNDQAIYHNEQILKYREDVREGLVYTTLHTLSQLCYAQERWHDALIYAEEWLAIKDEVVAANYKYIAQIHHAIGDYESAIENMELAVVLATEAGDLPIKKPWWDLLKYLHYEIENIPRVVEILEILVRDYPDRQTWMQLAGTYSEQNRLSDALYALESSHASGFFDRSGDYYQFASYLMNDEAYIRAAWVLEAGLKKEMVDKDLKVFQQYGQAWQASQEYKKAINVLEQAAEWAEDGEIHKRLANLYLREEEFAKCADAAESAIEKGVASKAYRVTLIQGMCEFNLDNLSRARDLFIALRRDARREDDENNARTASSWITYIDNEQKLRDELRRRERTLN